MPQADDYSSIALDVLRVRRPLCCPHCKHPQVARIAYGLSPTTAAGESETEIVPGGCVMTVNSPQWQCKSCGRGIFDHGLADAVSAEQKKKMPHKWSGRNPDLIEEEGVFGTFAEAREYAKSQARNSNSTVPITRKESGWYVPTIQQEKRNLVVGEDRYQEPSVASYGGRDYDQLGAFESEVAEIHAEINEYATNLSRSEEEGWFYDDENEDEARRKEFQREDDAILGRYSSE